MKTTLVLLSGGLIMAVGCSTQTSSRHASRTYYYPSAYASKTTVPASTESTASWSATSGQGGATAIASGSGLEITDQADIDLRKEELVVGKREVSNGGVLIRTVIETEPASQSVELQREEYVIERIPAGAPRDQQARTENAFTGREIYIPLMREEPVAGKRTILTEAIKLSKKVETDRQTITAPIRSEDVQIVKNPDLSDPKFSSVPRSTTSAGGITATEAGKASELTSDGALRLAREEFIVGKQQIPGGVYVQKVVRTENASQPVELQREEYVIERNPISGEVSGADFSPRQISLALKREEAVAGTRNYVTETVRLRKQMGTDKQMVSGTVRKESVEVVKLADTAQGAPGGTISGQSSSTLIAGEKSRDQILEEHVEQSLARPASASDQPYPNIDVSTESGVVTVKGTVASEREKNEIGKRIERMSGVRSVNNELEVKP